MLKDDSTNIKVTITQELVTFFKTYGAANQEKEVCAALGGTIQGNIYNCTNVFVVPNIAADPIKTYVPKPDSFLKVLKQTTIYNKDSKLDFLGIFHTHPNNAAYPSGLDIQGTGYKGVYLIYSVSEDVLNAFFVEKAKADWKRIHDLEIIDNPQNIN